MQVAAPAREGSRRMAQRKKKEREAVKSEGD